MIRKKAGGYTLVEIMLAILIFTGAMVTVLTLFPLSLRHVVRARIMTQAAFLCQAKMEEVLSDPGAWIADEYTYTGKFEPEFPDFSYVVRKYPYTYEENGKKIESMALLKIHVSVFHPINNRSAPLVEYTALKGGVGEQKGF